MILVLFQVNCVQQPGNAVRTGIAEVNGTKLCYEMAGSGTPLVFIHGNGGDCRHWDDQLFTFTEHYQVIRYDIRGYGQSALPDPAIPYSDYEDLRGLLDFLRISQAHICGLSMGSGIAVDFILAYPERCISVIHAGPWVNGYNSPATQKVFYAMGQIGPIVKEQGIRPAVDFWLDRDPIFKNTFRNPSTSEKMRRIGYDYSFWHFTHKNKRRVLQPVAAGRLAAIQAPTLVITAEYDLEACREVADLMEQKIPGAQKISIADAGHCMNMDQPAEFNRILSDFLQSVETR